MSLRFIDAEDIGDVVTAEAAVVVSPVVDEDADLRKRVLLGTVGRALLFADHFHDDNFDSFFDCLGESAGTVVLKNAGLWWSRDPALMGRLCQCFLDAGAGRALVCVV